MLLTNRRHRLLYICLAGMDLAVALPYLAILVALWTRRDAGAHPVLALLIRQPLAAFICLWAVMLAYMLAADLINRWGWPSPWRETAVLLLLVTTWLAAVLFLLYPSLSAADPRWLATAGSAVFNFTAGLRGELILLLGNFVLWWRISSYTDRELSFFSVGLTFRLGLLLAILGNALLAHFARQPQTVAVTYFILFFAFGLASVALARIDQKAVGANNSQGSLLPWSRLAQLLLAVASVMALAIAVATVYTPATLRSGLRALAPVGRLLQWLLIQVTLILFTVLSPVLEAIARVLAGLVGEPVEQPPVEPLVSGEYVSLADIVREWPLLRYCLVGGIIALALGLCSSSL